MRGKVLLVDDDVFVKEILSLMLADSEFDVIEAEDGKEAVEMFFEQKPDVVLMDIVMPKMSGIDATKEILKVVPEAVILAITAFSPRKGKDMLEAGAKEIISKPITRGKLVETIKKYMR